MSFISLFDVISVVVLDAKTCLCIPESAADAAAVYLKGIKTLLANALITLFINCNPILVMDQEVFQEIFINVSS